MVTMDPVKTFQLEVETEGHLVKENLRAILHSILFHRLLSPAKPKDIALEFPKITYVKCDDLGLDRDVDLHVQNAVTLTSSGITVVLLSFYERRERKGWLFSSGTVEHEWERWVIKLSTREAQSDQEQGRLKEQIEKNIHSCLLYIATMASEYRDHVPITGRIAYRIILPQNMPESWGEIIKKILTDTASTNVLG